MLWEVLSLQHPFDEYRSTYEADSQLEEAIINGLRPTTSSDLVKRPVSFQLRQPTFFGYRALTNGANHAAHQQIESQQAHDFMELFTSCWDPDPER